MGSAILQATVFAVSVVASSAGVAAGGIVGMKLINPAVKTIDRGIAAAKIIGNSISQRVRDLRKI